MQSLLEFTQRNLTLGAALIARHERLLARLEQSGSTLAKEAHALLAVLKDSQGAMERAYLSLGGKLEERPMPESQSTE